MFKKFFTNVSNGISSFFNDLNKKYLVGRILTSLYFQFKTLYEKIKVWPHIEPDVSPDVTPDVSPDISPDNPTPIPPKKEKEWYWRWWKNKKKD